MPVTKKGNSLTQDGSLTPERFAQVRAIFEAAVERPAAERRAFAAGACGADIELLREVEAMLAADGNADLLLDGKPSSSAPEEGRFPAGTVLAGRYRILGLLGHGGMGEVYKAFDLILNQTVALKFLAPGHINEAALVRFRNEVRIARQVSHPNVCRVYDLGMVEGLHFLSMEYIDGEDLASLLRRIGRLPQDKAIEFTRKICAGLSAAHERGVLHRDLKPSNIMIDSRGQVRITDFGLAGLAAEIPLSDLRSGTPAYMSPEQKAGREVTTRSDIYALGLVLHEMFTGKARQDTSSNPSDLVKDLDPTIERLILRCLEEDPKRRPQTALNVAMALPGADPIAAALAAGETPSPGMVAASTEKEGFHVRTSVILFIAIVACCIAGVAIHGKYHFLARAPLPIPPDALADRAQGILKLLGYGDQSGVVDYGFFCCDRQALENLNQYEPSRQNEILASHQPPITAFYYRRVPGLQEPESVALPANDYPDGTDFSRGLLSGIHLIMSADGKLIRFDAHPSQASASVRPVNWDDLFSAAGLDRRRFTEATPEAMPAIPADARFAWSGTYADNRKEQVRVEAAAWQGRPVLFDVRAFPAPRPGSGGSYFAGYVMMALIAAASVITAWRNLRLGRSDKHGAALIAGAAFLFNTASWALGPPHMLNPAQAHSFDGILMAIRQNLLLAVIMWAIYISVEPYVRRHWPDSLISWTRFSAGKLNNVLVASHILLGILVAEASFALGSASALSFGNITYGLGSFGASIGTVGESIGFWLNTTEWGLNIALALLLMAVLLRVLFRKMWVADLVGALLLTVPIVIYNGTTGWNRVSLAAWFTVSFIVWLWLLRRFGLLPVMVGFFFVTPSQFPVATSGWLAGRSLTIQIIPVAVAAWALCVIVANQNRPPVESLT
jgi:serine/threonine-protein kinase